MIALPQGARGADHPPALGREEPRDLGSDAAGGAGHHHDLAVELSHGRQSTTPQAALRKTVSPKGHAGGFSGDRLGKRPDGGGSSTTSRVAPRDRKSTRLNSSHSQISYAVFCLKKKKKKRIEKIEIRPVPRPVMTVTS